MGKLITLWLTPKFPKAHIEKVLSYNPPGFYPKIRNFYRTWFAHPIKRRIAKYYARILQKFFGLKIIGITGSTGKTTTKEMLASILKLDGETIYSFANIDPVYNIPTTIFQCRPLTKYLILEMGVEYFGEMNFYLWLVEPDLGIITNIHPTHTLNFRNEEGVLKEKSKLVRGLRKDGTAVLNSENSYLQKIKNRVSAKAVWFGDKSQVFSKDIKYSRNFKTQFVLHYSDNEIKVELPILGKHFVLDALAAAAGAFGFGLNVSLVKKGLENFNVQEHRMNIKKMRSGAILIDDSYNNNPAAAKEAIQTFKVVSGNRKTLLVFGDMLELGKGEIGYHKEIGKYIKQVGIDKVVGVGPLSRYISKVHVGNWEEALPLVKNEIGENIIILVKGSRGIKLDKLVEVIAKS